MIATEQPRPETSTLPVDTNPIMFQLTVLTPEYFELIPLIVDHLVRLRVTHNVCVHEHTVALNIRVTPTQFGHIRSALRAADAHLQAVIW